MTPRPKIETPEPVAPELPAGLAYDSLTDAMQKQLLGERLRGLEAEHYSHVLNLKVAQDHLGSPRESWALTEIANANAALVVIEQAHKVLSAELAALG